MTHSPDSEIAQEVSLRQIAELAALLGLEDEEIVLYGRHKAKGLLRALEQRRQWPDGKLVVVSSIALRVKDIDFSS